MKKVVLICIVLTVSGIAGWLSWPAFWREWEEAGIKKEIVSANYCETDSNCEIVLAKCPFNCYAPVNKKESGRIKKMIDSHESRCAYMCIEIKGVECVSGKCELLLP